MSDRVGQQFGNYRLLRLLGQGGQASVYLGEHLYLKNQAAIKVRHVALTKEEQTVFLQEAQILVRLSHPHIVRVLDFALQDGMPFLVMEYAAQGSLRQRHPRGTRLPLDVIVSYVQQVASALQYTHDQHLIHRDVKPENMLLDSREEVLLSDFGLVMLLPQTLSPEGTELMEQPLVGTTPYLAPEQLRGKARAASDQYALAVVVYEWLCGKPPFHGPFLEVALQQVSAPPPSLREHVSDVSPAIEAVVLRALAKEPEQRFANMQAFALALEEACRPQTSAGQPPPDLSSLRPSQAQRSPKYHLPAQPTPFIGREQEVARACELLSRPEVRLLTLTGPGGIGKTRLSLQVAARLSNRFVDGVFFVALAPISDPALFVATIAETLDIREVPGQPLLTHLKEQFEQKRMLLVLDNFEQIVSAASQVADLLASCPSLKVLVTSREVLHVQAEHEYSVPLLQLPDPKHLPDMVALSQYEAVALFIERAQAVKHDFAVTNANAHAVAAICARLDGLPLAIELAAARIKLLPPQALLARLTQRLVVLTSRARDVPARHQTLRSTITWSYDLLNTVEQQLFWRLSVFVGGCTLETVEAMCAILDGADAVVSVLDGVSSLLDKSLVQLTEPEGEEPRLMMLETIRQYGQECLHESREEELSHHAHAEYYLRFAEAAEPHLHDAHQFMWLQRFNREQENFRAALRWLIEHKQTEHALRLSVALNWYWYMRGNWQESLNWLRAALQLSNTEDRTTARANALGRAGILTFYQGNPAKARVLLEESITLHRTLGETAELAFAIMSLGEVYMAQEDSLTARSLMEESVVLCRKVGDKWRLAVTLGDLAQVVWAQGDDRTARALLEEGWVLVREVGDKWSETRVNTILAIWARAKGNYALAATHYQEALSVAQQTGDIEFITQSLAALGDIAKYQGDNAKALDFYTQGLMIAREVGDQFRTIWLLCGLGDIARHEDNDARATALYREGLSLAMMVENKWYVGWCLLGLARMARRSRMFWRAAVLLSATQALVNVDKDLDLFDRAEYERDVADICTQLSEEVFTAAWAEGRTMTPEQALAAQEPVTLSTAIPKAQPTPPPIKSPPTYPDGLTTREVEVLRLLAQGLTDTQIAEQLVISSRTVNNHLTSIYSKIQVSSRSAATRYAIEHQLA